MWLQAERENQSRTSKGNSKKSWSGNAQNTKEIDPLDNMGIISYTEPIINYQEGYNIPVKDHKINRLNKAGIHRKDEREQEVRDTEIVIGVVENGETNVELVVGSSEKEKIKSESKHNLVKVERTEGQYAEETTIRKDYDNISEILTKKAMKKKETTGNKNKNSIGLTKQESTSQVKQISYDLIQEINSHQSKEAKACTNITITTDENPRYRHRTEC